MAFIKLKLPPAYKKGLKEKGDAYFERGKGVFGDWLAERLISYFFFSYLGKKYHSHCYSEGILNIDLKLLDNTIKSNNVEEIIRVNDNLEKSYIDKAKYISICLLNNPETQIVIIPLSITFDCPGFSGGHMNLLIYRVQENTIEHFEPNGINWFSSDEVKICYDKLYDELNKLKFYIEEIRFRVTPQPPLETNIVYPRLTIRLLTAYDLYSDSGLQYLEGRSRLPDNTKGYCAAWCLFFADVVYRNPELDSTTLLQLLLEDANGPVKRTLSNLFTRKNVIRRSWHDYFRNVIKGYIFIIEDKMKKYFKQVYNKDVTLRQIMDIRTKGIDELDSNKLLDDFWDYMVYNKSKESGKYIQLVDYTEMPIENYFNNITPASARNYDFSVKNTSYKEPVSVKPHKPLFTVRSFFGKKPLKPRQPEIVPNVSVYETPIPTEIEPNFNIVDKKTSSISKSQSKSVSMSPRLSIGGNKSRKSNSSFRKY
jgi:hypothetical protein